LQFENCQYYLPAFADRLMSAFVRPFSSTFFSLCGHFLETFADLCRPKMPLLMYGRHLPAFVTIEFCGLPKQQLPTYAEALLPLLSSFNKLRSLKTTQRAQL
jgi:hypothetical protein